MAFKKREQAPTPRPQLPPEEPEPPILPKWRNEVAYVVLADGSFGMQGPADVLTPGELVRPRLANGRPGEIQTVGKIVSSADGVTVAEVAGSQPPDASAA